MIRVRPASLAVAGAVLALAATTYAQIEGGTRGVAAVDSSGDYEVSGVRVDVAAGSADAARYGGWRLAQRKAWTQLSRRLGAGGGTLPDGVLDSIVTGIVVEHEDIGAKRYVAKLGVMFDRGRASAILGISDYVSRSAPMVVIPVVWSGGVGEAFEARSPWQQAWARYRTGNSTLDYIRPSGSGPDALLLNVGQAARPGRGWWRTVLDLYGGTDVLIPTVRLYRQYPGGPAIGVFQARHGPDNTLLEQFTLRVGSAAGLPRLLDEGVRRIDEIYQRALRSGALLPDPGLSPPPSDDAPIDAATIVDDPNALDLPMAAVSSQIIVQFDTPDAAAVGSGEAAVRGVPGVVSAATSSLALGGVSLMNVGYSGPPDAFKTALEARGWQVFGSGTTLRIRRAPRLLPPDIRTDDTTAG